MRLAQVTVAYNVVECTASVVAGVLAGLVSLVGFGATRRSSRPRRCWWSSTSPHASAGVMSTSTRSLVADERPDASPIGMAILVASVVVMPLLARAKRRVGEALGGDRLVLADAAETRLCVLLSASTLAGLVLYSVTGATWLDPVAGLVIAVFAVHEVERPGRATTTTRVPVGGGGRGIRTHDGDHSP